MITMSEFTQCASNERPLQDSKLEVLYTIGKYVHNVLVKIGPELNQPLFQLINALVNT